MNKKEIYNAFAEIGVSKNLENQILNMTINNTKIKSPIFKLSYITSVVCLFCFLFISVVYAEEIKDIVEKWSISMHLEDGTKVKISENNNYKYIPTSAIRVQPNETRPEMTYDEIEDMLDIKLLKLGANNTDEIYYGTGLNKDGSIGRVDLWIPFFIKQSEQKTISVAVSILNNKADNSYALAYQEGLDATGEKNIENQYKSINLDTNIIIYSNEWSSKRVSATFVHDDILYHFTCFNYSIEEIKQVIETLI